MKRRLLMLTPTMPDDGGIGLQRRAAAMLVCLSKVFDVDLVVVPLGTTELGPLVACHTRRAMVLDAEAAIDTYLALAGRISDPGHRSRAMAASPLPWMARFSTAAAAQSIAAWLGPAPFEAIHVHRLSLAPLAAHLMQIVPRPTTAVLDLDDDEIVVHQRLAGLARRNCDPVQAEAFEIEGRKLGLLAVTHLPLFDRITVCSEFDQLQLSVRHPGENFSVIPNVYPTGLEQKVGELHAGPLRLLFVGALDFAPNVDAVMFLCLRLLPSLQAMTDRPVELVVAGRSPAEAVQYVCESAGARLVHSPADISPFYQAADIALVPLRAGGGTRIKILEAFAHDVPVITTAIGAEGLEVSQEHLVMCDLDQFAEACLELARNSEKASSLRKAGRRLLEGRYSPAAMRRCLGELYSETGLAEEQNLLGMPSR